MPSDYGVYWDDADPQQKRRRYDQLRAALLRSRQQGFDKHWRRLGEFLMPRRTRFWAGDRNQGGARNGSIIDSTPRFAARTLSSGLHAGLTSPARPWMKLSTPDPKLAQLGPVREWLHVTTERMLTMFATTNLYNVLPLVYLDLGIFGTSAMSIVEDTKDLFRCYSYPIGSYAIGLNARGLASTFVRDYQLTVRQVVEQFGLLRDRRRIDWAPISKRVRDLWEKGEYEAPISVTWLVKPNDGHRADRLEAKYLPFASCYWETDHAEEPAKFLRESGFETFPIMAPRWDITGEDTYGTDCPGMTALGDVMQLQEMQKLKAKLLEKAVDPPLRGPSSLRQQAPTSVPNSITYVDARDGMQGLAPIHEVRLEGFQHMTADIGAVQYRVQRAFYEDLFLMLARTDDKLGAARPTAREIEERHEEKLLALGPVLERTNDELLDPIVDRVYHLMERAGLLPDAPPELDGVELRVEYISILAQAQKAVAVAQHDRLLQTAAALREMFPTLATKFNEHQIVNTYAEMLGTDPRILRTDDEADAIVQQQQQAAQQQFQAEQAATMAKAARDNAAAPMGGDTALSRLVSNAGTQPPLPYEPAAA